MHNAKQPSDPCNHLPKSCAFIFSNKHTVRISRWADWIVPSLSVRGVSFKLANFLISIFISWSLSILFRQGNRVKLGVDNIDTMEMRPNIVFWHSKSYFDIRTEDEYRILTFEILFWHSKWYEYWILTFTFEIPFWLSDWGWILYFDIRNFTLTFELSRISNFDFRNPILTFEVRTNMVFWRLKHYFDIRTEAEYRVLTIRIPFSASVRMSKNEKRKTESEKRNTNNKST